MSANQLHGNLAELDVHYSNRFKLDIDDKMRTENVLLGVKGKRLTYGSTNWLYFRCSKKRMFSYSYC